MKALVGSNAPDFVLPAAIHGEASMVSLKDLRGKYVVLFFYPKDFTYVCPTELLAFQDALQEFASRNAVVLGCSVDSVDSHLRWLQSPRSEGGIQGISYPLLSDETKQVSKDYGVLLESEGLSLRGTFLIDREGIIRHAVINDLPLGRSVDEEIRTLDALMFFEANGLVCPAHWKPGDRAMAPTQEGLKEYFSHS